MKINKLISSASAICLASMLSNAYAADYTDICSEKHDTLYCGKATLDNLHYLGDAVLDGTTVTGSMKITGDLEMHHSHVNNINIIGDLTANDSDVDGEAIVKGNATLSNIKFKAPTRIVGDVKASNTEFATDSSIIGDMDVRNTNFKGTLTLAADKAYMAHSNALTINFTKTYKSQNLYLNQNSFVNGDINFPSNHGSVYISDGARVSGKISGGKVAGN